MTDEEYLFRQDVKEKAASPASTLIQPMQQMKMTRR